VSREFPDAMIRVESLAKAYGSKQVLRNVTFSAAAGTVNLLVGLNGAGKSTIMRTLAGLICADSGDAKIAGYSICHEKLTAQRRLSYLPQNPMFHPGFTCRQIVHFYARLRGLNAAKVADTALESVGLREVSRERSGSLSGGMRQRLGIAVLLLADAPVLLLDEPGLSLDAEWRQCMQTILREEARRGKTVLVTTHLLSEWNNAAHRCLVCREGVIAGEIDPAHLTDAPLNEMPEMPSAEQDNQRTALDLPREVPAT
jgi:ABC-2 type transport system ATP-binding protein